jgi:ABC-type Fe3+/spermidine/putrescine transport system ATPase subunit
MEDPNKEKEEEQRMVICEIRKKLRDFELNIEFTLEKETMVIVGHSGSGKSATLRAIAGLLTPDEGRIEVDGQVFYSQDSKINVDPEHRGVGFLFQNYALFPHLTVLENVSYGLAARKVPKAEQIKRALDQLMALNIEEFRDSMPEELSGGQQQRVALARALVLEPNLLILDEPLSALDVTTRGKVRKELKKTLSSLQIPAIIVTHDYEDAISLGHKILVMDQGVVIQEGTPQELVANPRSAFVADFSGTNYFTADKIGELEGLVHYQVLGWGEPMLSVHHGQGELSLMIHPWDITLTKEKPVDKDRNIIFGQIVSLLIYGNRVRVDIEGVIPLTIELLSREFEDLGLKEGELVYALVDPSFVHVLQKVG